MSQRVTVSELKAHLSGYLGQVRTGRTFTVCNRKTPIARLVPVDDRYGEVEVAEATDPDDLSVGPRVRLKKRIDVVALLRADRDDR